MRIWLFRTFLIFVVVAVGSLGWFALQTRSLSPGLDPTLAALATGLSANTATGSPTFTAAPPTESPTPAPTLSSEFGTLILALRVSGRTHLHAYLPGASNPIPLTSGDWDDRDPSISPDGTKIAFASDREGGWDLYVLDLDSGEIRRLTNTASYEGNPSWSPDAFYIAYENYQGSDFDIWILSVDGSQAPIQLTNQPSLEISPSWDPGGRRIAFISDRDGNPNVFVADLDKPDDRFHNLTRSPNEVESDPSFSADGANLAFVSNAHGLESILMLPMAEPGASPHSVGQGRRPAWSPEGGRILAVLSTPYGGSSLVVYGTRPSIAAAVPLLTLGSVESAVWIEGGISGGWASSTVGAGQASLAPGILASRNADGRLRLVTLPGLKAPQPMLSDAVDEAFIALRDRAAAVLGWDFLSQLDYAFVGLNDPLPPGFQFNDWLYTGRGFAFSQGAVEAGWVEIVREDFAGQTYWRVYVRALRQDGSQGEPLRESPWDFRSRRLSDPLAYDQGGRPDADIPDGYYVDFTLLAGDFGFERLSALANWRTYLPGTRFNEFAMTGGLSWEQAMLELYPAGAIATPTEFRTPTVTPTRTPRPTVTPWWWWWRTPTPSATQGPSATPSATP